MLSLSLFSNFRRYLSQFKRGALSLLESCRGVLPYLWSKGELQKEVTEQYPDPVSSRTEDDLPARTRGLLFNDIDRCTGCKDCETVCPVDCIRVVVEAGPNTNKKWVSVFDVDFGNCIFCGLCVDVCKPQSLVHSKQFEGSVFLSSELVAGFGRGAVSPELREKWHHLRQSEESLEL